MSSGGGPRKKESSRGRPDAAGGRVVGRSMAECDERPSIAVTLWIGASCVARAIMRNQPSPLIDHPLVWEAIKCRDNMADQHRRCGTMRFHCVDPVCRSCGSNDYESAAIRSISKRGPKGPFRNLSTMAATRVPEPMKSVTMAIMPMRWRRMRSGPG